MDYNKKYLKYKNKYLNLKNKIAGATLVDTNPTADLDTNYDDKIDLIKKISKKYYKR